MAVYPSPYTIVPIFEPAQFPSTSQSTSDNTGLYDQYTLESNEAAALGMNTGAYIQRSLGAITGLTSGETHKYTLPTLVVGGIYLCIFHVTIATETTNHFLTGGLTYYDSTDTVLYTTQLKVRAGVQNDVTVWTLALPCTVTYTSGSYLKVTATTNSGTWTINDNAYAQQQFANATFSNGVMIMRLQ